MISTQDIDTPTLRFAPRNARSWWISADRICIGYVAQMPSGRWGATEGLQLLARTITFTALTRLDAAKALLDNISASTPPKEHTNS